MFKILLIIFLTSIGIFFSFAWAIIYILARFGVNRKITKLMVVFFIGGSLMIIGFTLWSLFNIE